jgi:hypothetical protein
LDPVWEREKLEARQKAKKRARSEAAVPPAVLELVEGSGVECITPALAGGAREAIVAIARKLLVAVWYILAQHRTDRFAQPEGLPRSS